MTGQGEVYTDFIQEQLEKEFARRERLETRGWALIASSGVLASLTFAGVAAYKGKDYRISGQASLPLMMSLSALVVSAVLGVATCHTWKYKIVAPVTMTDMLRDHWMDSEASARNYCGQLNVFTISTLRVVNNRKAFLLTLGLALELVAAVCAVWAILVITAST
ncbi:hypothetical protein ACFWOL_34885 [Streptomyces sp. NPDC058442]|uniref:hypothetical protein n=1 Tax=Streptomyces sp. NPDC058442 TaxID=3346503 RepID=UPI003646CE0A